MRLTARRTIADLRLPFSPITREWVLAVAVLVAVPTVVWASQVIEPSATVRNVAQFAHLACVVLGLGSVLVVDWLGLRWMLGSGSLSSVIEAANALAMPIWMGLGGLLLSGVFLQPDLSTTLTRIKVGLVLAIGLVGVIALALHRRLAATSSHTPRLLRSAMILAAASQLCWWSAAVIGFVNRS